MDTPHAQSSAVEVDVADTDASSLDVLVRWGTSVLHVAHLTPPRTFHLGVAPHDCDCVLPASLLGASRVPLVVVDRRGAAWLVILPGATGTLALRGEPEAPLESPHAPGVGRGDAALGAYRVRLPPGSKGTLTLGGVIIEVGLGQESRLVVGGYRYETRSWLVWAAVIALHVGLFCAAKAAMPPLGETGASEGETQDQRFFIAIDGPDADGDEVEPRADEEADHHPDEQARVSSKCSETHGGSMGKPIAKDGDHRYGVRGPADNADPHVARDPYPHGTWPESMIGLPEPYWGGDGEGPVAPWGRDDALGTDAKSARGHMWGEDLAEAFGSPGAGIGLRRLCETCGSVGMGARARLHTLPAGDTGTETAAGLLVAAR
jgi:hypothetical protein